MSDGSNYNDKNKTPWLKRALDAFGTMFALNICFVVGCIPVFTIGASLSALYAMCIRLQEDEEETVLAGFIHEFKRSFKQSTIAFLWILLALVIMYFEYLVVLKVPGMISTFYTFVLMIEVIILLLILPFLFPLISRYKNKLSVTFRNALVLSITYFGSCIKILVAWFAPAAICILYPNIFVQIWYLWLLLIFGAIGYGTSYTVRKVFRKNEERMDKAKEAEEEAEQEEDDESDEESDDESDNEDENNSENDSDKDIE